MMNGVNGNQSSQNISISNNSTPKNTPIQQGSFSRFQVTVMTSVKQFFSSLLSSGTSNTAIHARQVEPMNTPSNSLKANSSNTFEQALDLVKDQPGVKQSFAKVHSALDKLQGHKDNLSNSRRGTDTFRENAFQVRLAKEELKSAVANFNKITGSDLKLNSGDLEMGMANRHSEGFIDEQVQQLKQMENTLL